MRSEYRSNILTPLGYALIHRAEYQTGEFGTDEIIRDLPSMQDGRDNV